MLAAAVAAAGVASAVPGSGSATIIPSDPVAAGTWGSWTIDYVASEPFHPSRGGIITVAVPSGWSAPVVGPLVAPGHVVVSGPGTAIDSVIVRGRVIWVYAGGNPNDRLFAGDHIVVSYGMPAPAGAAQAQTTAPATAVFAVASDPDGMAPQPLANGSPSLAVVPAAALYMIFEPATLDLVAGEPALLRLAVRDQYDNEAAPGTDQLVSLTTSSPTLRVLSGGLSVSEVVIPADSTGLALEVVETRAGSGTTLRAADGDGVPPALTPAVATVDTRPGPAARLSVAGIPDPITAGSAASVVVEALDAHDNRAVDYGGTVGFATSDPGSGVLLPADYTFGPADQGIHLFAGAIVLTTAGEQWLTAIDRVDPQISGTQADITVEAADPSRLTVSGIDDPAVAGRASDVVVEARDAHGNLAAGYLGTVTFSTDDTHPGVILPADYTFTPADAGRRVFPGGVTLQTAGVHLVAADDTTTGFRGEQTGIDVGPGPPALARLFPPGSIPVSAGGEQPIVLAVEDAAANPVPGEQAAIAIVDPADGALASDPDQPGGTQGNSTVQAGVTDTGGLLRVRYLAPQTAGLVDSIGAWTAVIGSAQIPGIEVVTTASGATRLVLLPAGAITDTASAAIPLVVEAQDSYGNLDAGATPLVRLSASSATARFSVDSGVSWSTANADSLVLTAGSSGDRIRLRDPRAGAITLTAGDAAGFLAAALRNDVTIRPAPAAGAIPLSVIPDTLTADGRSEAQVGGGPVTDRHGNAIAGGLVTVATSLGTVVAVDESPAPGIQRLTDSTGRFGFAVRAAESPGQALISAASGPGPEAGTAGGSAPLVFTARVHLALTPNTLDPASAAPGDTIAFAVAVENLGPVGATCGGGTVIHFAEPGGASYASPLAAPVTVPAGGSGLLHFAPSRVDPGFTPGQYTPLFSLRGTDAQGSAIDTLLSGDVGGFGLSGLVLGAVTAPGRVARGQSGVGVAVEIENPGSGQVVVTGVDLAFSAPAYAERGVEPTLPFVLGPRAEQSFTVTVDIDPLASLGPVRIDASAAFQTGSGPRGASGATPATWIVDTAAELAAVTGSLAPQLASAGQVHATGVVVVNQGTAGVVLDPIASRLVFGPAGNELIAALPAPLLVAGGGATALRFTDLALPGGYPPGRWPVRLELAGSEHGAPYSTVLALADSLRVVTPAALTVVAGSVAPDSVALGQIRSFSLHMVNNGGAAIALREGTVLRLSGGVVLDFELTGGEQTLGAGEEVVLTFAPGEIVPALGTGGIPLAVAALTRENGLEGAVLVPAPSPLRVEAPALLRWVGASLTPSRVTRGQLATFGLQLANDGEAAVTLLAGSELEVSDGVHHLRVGYPGPALVVPGGGAVTIGFPPALVPADLAAQAYAPLLSLLTVEHGLAGSAAVTAPPGELTVESAADLHYVRGTLAPDVAVAGQNVAFRVVVENRGGAAIRPAAETTLDIDAFSVGLDMLRTPAEIHANGVDTLFFAEAPLVTVNAGMHAPAIDFHGNDWNGEPVALSLDLSPDLLHVVVGAALRVIELTSSAPRGAVVNRGQHLPLRLRVTNPGEEGVAGATATIGGAGLASPVSVPLGAIAGGDTAAFGVEAVAAATPGPGLVSATLAGGAGAISGSPPMLLPAADDTLRLAVEREAQLAARIAVSGPSGATDGIVSSGSLFDVEVAVDNAGDAPIGTQGVVELSVPPGFGVLGPRQQRFAAGEPVPFAVVAPPAAAARDSLTIAITAVPSDLNTGEPAEITRGQAKAAVEVVAAARLAVAAGIIAPENARAGTALPEQIVTIEAVVTNGGTAAAPGTGALNLTLGSPELTLAPGETADRSFTVGEPVEYRVVAASQTSPPHPITVRVTATPPDENTGLPAALERPEATVGLATQALAAELAGDAMGLAAPALLRATEPVPVMTFSVSNAAPAGHALVLQAIAPALFRLDVEDATLARRGGGLARLGTSATQPIPGTLSRIELWRETGELVTAWSGSGAPVLVLADTLAGQETRRYLLAVSVDAAAPAGTYRLALGEPGALGLEDPISGEPVPFVLAAGLVESAPLTLYERPLAAPNPFTPGTGTTRITYVLAGDTTVTIEIFTLYGDRVWSRSLASGSSGGRLGLNQVIWDGRNSAGDAVRNGVYHCRIRGDGIDSTVKIAVIR